MILGVPPGEWGWVDGGGGWWEVAPYTCAHAHTCTHAYEHACAYDIIGNPRDFPKSNGGGHLREITMFTMHTCACVRVRMCACMCTCVGGTPNHPPSPSTHPPSPSTHPPTPKSRRKLKTPKFNNSWTNQDNLILFEDSLPLNIPELI